MLSERVALRVPFDETPRQTSLNASEETLRQSFRPPPARSRFRVSVQRLRCSGFALFRKLSGKTGLRATPHMFRHTHATDLLRAGWDAAYVQRRLGHAQIQTTVNTYGHLSTGDLGEMFARYQKERAR